MLTLAGEGVRAEVIERLAYEPSNPQDSGDLEAATKTITDTAMPGTPDYTAGLTVPAPADNRITVTRLGLRLQVTIDSITAGQLNYAVKVNGVERLTGNWTGTGAKYAAVDLTTGQFNLGSANTIQVFLWVDAGNAVVSLCQIWLGVGTSDTSYWGTEVLTLAPHTGLMNICSRIGIVGSGTPKQMLLDGGFTQINIIAGPTTTGILANPDTSCLVAQGVNWLLGGSVETDLNFVYGFTFVLRREA